MKNDIKQKNIISNACVKTVGGKPMLFVDGKITPPLIYSLASHCKPMRTATALSQRNIKYFAEAGIDLVEVEAILSNCWRKSGEFSEMPIYAEVAEVVRANPKAKVILRLHLQPPYWWLRDNPEELCELAEYKTTDNGEPYFVIGETDKLTYHESFASKKWISDTSEKLALLCDRLKNSDMAEHIAGIHVGSGIYSEWHYYGFGGHPDYSICMQRRFKEFLKEKYGTVDKLRAAWGNADVTFETAELPHFSRRFPENDSYFRDPIKDRDVADNLECLQDAVADAVITFCKIVKKNWNEILTGAFYGYFFGVFGILATTGGHLSMKKICDNEKYIDFLCAPLCYYENRRVEGTFFPRGLLESERLNNILWLTEMDSAPFEIGIWQNGKTVKDNSPDVKEKSSFALKRNILGNLTRGMGAWFFDHHTFDDPVKTSFLKDSGWWEDERYRKDIKNMREIYDRVYSLDYKDETDVLLVYDTEVYYEMTRAVFSEETIEP
ncbi:MAG: beta-galactosidase, partial [Clostridia bacterium]|nr:beta-galactosidase [Clostridia bacterium]